MLVGVCIITQYLITKDGVSEFWEIMVMGVLVGFGGAVVQGSMFAIAGCCTGAHTSAVSSGIGFAGIIMGILKVITKAATEGAHSTGTHLYFSSAYIVLLISIVAYIFLIDNSHVRFYYEFQFWFHTKFCT